MFEDLITKKKAVFVGPSPYLIGQGKGDYIDSFDTVIRTNSGYPIKEDMQKDYGSRCDILYINRLWSRMMTNENLDDYAKNNVKILVFKFLEPEINKKCILHKKYFDLRPLPRHNLVMGTTPNLGILAINDIINFSPKNIGILGIDFYEDHNKRYFDGYHSEELIEKTKDDMHDQRENVSQFINVCKGNKRKIILDNYVKQRIEECKNTINL